MTVCGWMQGCEVHKADLIGTNKGWGHRHTHTNRLGENQPIQKPWLCIIIFRLFAVCVRNKDDRCQAFINAPYGVSSKTTTTTTTKHIHTHIKKKRTKTQEIDTPLNLQPGVIDTFPGYLPQHRDPHKAESCLGFTEQHSGDWLLCFGPMLRYLHSLRVLWTVFSHWITFYSVTCNS